MSGVRSARACLFLASKGDERDVSAPLYRHGDFSLMPGAVARDAPRQNFTAFGYEESKRFYIFVVDKWRFIHAKAAHFLAYLEPSAFVAAGAWSAIISISSAS